MPPRHRRPRPPLTGLKALAAHARRRQSLPVRLLARMLVGVLVPLLGVTWLLGNHNVTLQVDGQPQQLTTHASTVAELLERAGVAFGKHDAVTPPPGTPLREGMVVELVHAREITVLIGDKEDTVLVTALSVDEVLDQLTRRRDVSQRATVRPSRLTPVRSGMTVRVLNPVAVTVVADGKEREVVTDAPNVARLLERLGIRLRGRDRVTPAPETAVQPDLRITVERVRVERQRRTASLDFETIRRPTDRLAQGQEREVRAGRNGTIRLTERVTFVDGNEVSRHEIRRRLVTAPLARIVEEGTAPPPRATPTDRNQDTEPAPQPRPSPSTRATERATENSQTGQASYYHYPEEGMIAAHRTLPMGTVVTVTNRANGKSVTVTINDRGPYIDGRIIDLNEPAFTQIAARSAGVIDVRITW
ncbi:MAG: DUF348 domain-containing protein [Nitriliruptorales bacterium]|nr:DUF348 domain-containing protein [Nitriliruptorales bacterium]